MWCIFPFFQWWPSQRYSRFRFKMQFALQNILDRYLTLGNGIIIDKVTKRKGCSSHYNGLLNSSYSDLGITFLSIPPKCYGFIFVVRIFLKIKPGFTQKIVGKFMIGFGYTFPLKHFSEYDVGAIAKKSRSSNSNREHFEFVYYAMQMS